MGLADKFDTQDAVQCLLGSGAGAFAIFSSKTIAPLIWKSLTVLCVFLAIILYANYKKRKSVEHILIALAFIAVIIYFMGLFLDQTMPDITVGIVGGFIGGLGFDTLLGKGK